MVPKDLSFGGTQYATEKRDSHGQEMINPPGVPSQSTGFFYMTPRPNFIFAREHVKNEMVQ